MMPRTKHRTSGARGTRVQAGVAPPHPPKARHRAGPFKGGRWLIAAAAVVVALVTVALLQGTPAPASSAAATRYPYAVGSPGPGAEAPAIRLRSTDGSIYDLSARRGKSVLIFFQEGVGCQSCWEQLKDIESNMSAFKDQGIDEVVTVTGDPTAALKQKVALEGLRTPVLSDPGLAVSVTYHANGFGMMGNSADGHSFIVVGPDGRIRSRADYGGAPNYTMYVPTSQLISDMRSSRSGS